MKEHSIIINVCSDCTVKRSLKLSNMYMFNEFFKSKPLEETIIMLIRLPTYLYIVGDVF